MKTQFKFQPFFPWGYKQNGPANHSRIHKGEGSPVETAIRRLRVFFPHFACAIPMFCSNKDKLVSRKCLGWAGNEMSQQNVHYLDTSSCFKEEKQEEKSLQKEIDKQKQI